MANEPHFVGDIEISGKSLFLVIRELYSEKEQVFPVIEVPSNASMCYMYGLWEQAIGDLSLGEEYVLLNKDKVELKLQALQEEIDSHFRLDCECSETIDTQHFRGLSMATKANSFTLEIQVYSNRARQVLNYQIIEFSSLTEVLENLLELLKYAVSHENFNRNELLDLSNFEHDLEDVALQIGSIYENLIYTHNVEPSSLTQEIEFYLQDYL